MRDRFDTTVKRGLILWTLIFAPELQAQCPNGSPPPCRSAARADSNLFVVLPFAVRGPPEVQYLRDAMVDLLHMSLDGVSGLRVAYPPATLNRLRGLSDPTDALQAVGIARDLGAERIIGGAVVNVGTEMRIRADVFDTQGKRRFSAESHGPLASLSDIADSVASAILAYRLIGPAQRQPHREYATKSVEALRAMLVAEQAERRGEWRVAAESLQKAIKHDPDYGLAHWLLTRVQASGNVAAGIVPGGMAAVLNNALAHSSRFSERIRALFELQLAAARGDRETAIARADAAVSRFPDDAEITLKHADVFFHFGINVGRPRDEVLGLYRRAFALDDREPELLGHYLALVAESGDTATLWRLYRHCANLRLPGCGDSVITRLLVQHAPAAEIARDRVTPVEPNLFRLRAGPDLPYLVALTDSLAVTRKRTERSNEERYIAWAVRYLLAITRGQYDSASAHLDSAALLNDHPELVLQSGRFALFYDVVTGRKTTRAENAFARLRQSANPLDWALRALYATQRMSVDSAQQVIAAQPGASWLDSARLNAVASGMRGLLSLRRGDTAAARDQLLLARSNDINRSGVNRAIWPGVFFATRLASIEAARGNHNLTKLYLADAYPVNRAAPFIAEVEELRAKASLALGSGAEARASLRTFIALWQNADPELQPRVAAARAQLAQLAELRGTTRITSCGR